MRLDDLIQFSHERPRGRQIRTPVAAPEWPIWAKALKQFATPEDKGIGDVVARVIGPENSARFKAWLESTFKCKCGCIGRQKRWNTMYPFNPQNFTQPTKPLERKT